MFFKAVVFIISAHVCQTVMVVVVCGVCVRVRVCVCVCACMRACVRVCMVSFTYCDVYWCYCSNVLLDSWMTQPS